MGLALGIVWGFIAVSADLQPFTTDYIKPWGRIFVNLLKLIAIPLIFLSLVNGISSLGDISKLGKLGFKTITIYIATTVFAVILGLLLANSIGPGRSFPQDLREKLELAYAEQAETSQNVATGVVSRGPLSFLEDMVPDNIFSAMSTNSAMLQVILFSVLFGIALLKIDPHKKSSVIRTIDAFNDVILKLVGLIMYFAPLGVFALIGGMITDVAGKDSSSVLSLFSALGWYMLTVIIGLFFLLLVAYPLLVFVFNRKKFPLFFKSIYPAQLLAFTTSSSAATLPMTMDCCETKLKISPSISRFVLPVGATINMDGTSLYQAVATIFIAQAFGTELSFTAQLTIVLTATLASIGSAAVPGAGLIMLVMVLQSVGLSVQGISLILAVDRILDMFRTVVNVTGDMTVATILDRNSDKIGV